MKRKFLAKNLICLFLILTFSISAEEITKSKEYVSFRDDKKFIAITKLSWPLVFLYLSRIDWEQGQYYHGLIKDKKDILKFYTLAIASLQSSSSKDYREDMVFTLFLNQHVDGLTKNLRHSMQSEFLKSEVISLVAILSLIPVYNFYFEDSNKPADSKSSSLDFKMQPNSYSITYTHRF